MVLGACFTEGGIMTFDSQNLHPTRYRRSRPMARDLVRAHQTAGGDYFPNDLTGLMTPIMATYNRLIDTIPREDRPQPMDVQLLLVDEMLKFCAWRSHTANGAVNFVLTPELAESLSQTDLGDVRLSDLEPPFNSFYLHFGGIDVGGLIGPPNRIDGVYVLFEGAFAVRTIFTSRLIGREEAWPMVSEPFLEVELTWKGSDETLVEVFGRAIQRLQLAEQSREIGRSGRTAVFSGQLVQNATYLSQAAACVVDALNLLGNAVCYLSAAPEVSSPGPPSDLSGDLEATLNTGSKSAKQRAKAEMLERGFQLIRWLGPKHTPAQGTAPHIEGTKRQQTRSHWRRGHWRRQAFGEGRAARRLVWIKPMLISGRAAGHSDRAYLVD